MRRYETIVILRPGLSEDEVSAVIDKATETITSFDGSIVENDKWGLKKLAYPIKKEPQGYYVYLEYAGVPAAVDEMERLFRIDDRVLKYLTIKTQDIFSKDFDEQRKKAATESKAEDADDTDDVGEAEELS